MTRHALTAAATKTEDELYGQALGAADSAEAAIRKVWDDLMKVIAEGGNPGYVNLRVRQSSEKLFTEIVGSLSDSFVKLGLESHRTTVENLKAHMPVEIVQKPAPVGLQLDPLSNAVEQTAIRESLVQEKLLDFILAPPSPLHLLNVIYRGDWAKRIASLTRLALPGVLAAAIARGTLELKTPYELAREIRPLVQGVQVSARRIARTECLRIAHTVQMDTYEKLGDMVIGYQVHAVLDSRTRPAHRERDGFIFYKNPKPGQRPMSECPKPPMESNGKPAFNCRCFLSPVFAPLQKVEQVADQQPKPPDLPVAAFAPM
jgi:SPP1 gp7 family putative phage head morphogenesis protein